MIKKFSKTDYIFAAVLLAGLLFHVTGIFVPNSFEDESFYSTIPYRVINGEFLVQHEWHLSQFSSLFSYLPVFFWLKLTGSANGIILYLRFVYLFVHTVAATAVYGFFRKYKGVAIGVAMMLYAFIPYTMYAVSYTSMFVLGLAMFTFSLQSVYNTQSVKAYVLAGSFYGVCCVNNPVFCVLYFVYIAFCAVQSMGCKKYYNSIKKKSGKQKNKKSAGGKSKNTVTVQQYSCFFSKKAAIYSFAGLCIIALVSLIYFFATGGTLRSIVENMENMLNSSEFKIVSSGMKDKLSELMSCVNKISFNMPFLLPVLFIALAFDKNRKNPTNRLIYLCVAFLLGVLFVAGMAKSADFRTSGFSMLFSVFSLVCYILTNRKNKTLFKLMWCPCAVAAVISFMTSNTVLYIIGAVLAVSNVAGVFFVKDLAKEMLDSQYKEKTKSAVGFIKTLFAAAYICQIIIYMLVLQYFPFAEKGGLTVISDGPYKGTVMYQTDYKLHEGYLEDMKVIKKLSDEKAPVLLASLENWAYLYLERPIATYTTWYRGGLYNQQLTDYYTENPDKIPAYIYIDSYNHDREYDAERIQHNMNIASELFEFTQRELKNDILLTVTGCKFTKQ